MENTLAENEISQEPQKKKKELAPDGYYCKGMNRREYMSSYMRQRYANDTKSLKRRNISNLNRDFIIADETREFFEYDLHLIIKINELVNKLDEGSLEKYLNNRHMLKYAKK